MPMKSKAQRRKFAELLVNGEISPEVYERWNRETGSKELPERVTPKKGKTKAAPQQKATKAKRTVKRKAKKRATTRRRV